MVARKTFAAVLVACVSFATSQSGYGDSNGTSSSSSSLANAPYRDPSVPIEDRINDLISRMTIREKASQLMQGDISNWLNTTSGAFNFTGLSLNFEQKAGMFYVGYPISWDWLADGIKRGQDYAVNSTRLGIPAIVQTEGIHGFLIENATIFNSPIAYACTWNRTQTRLMAEQIAREAQALGVSQLFAPLADLARELRYGRVEETFGEDGYLAGETAAAYIRGLQSLNVSAMVKHYAAFGLPEQGLNTGPEHMGERELRTTWLPSYHKAIADAGVWSIMSAYHSLDGIPAVSDEFTLTEILREELEYDFFVTSDAGGTDRLADNFYICPKPLNTYNNPITEGNECITLSTLPSGGDVEMGGGSFNYRAIPELVASGRLDEAIVDKAVSRVLRTKFTMGLFERPYQIAPKRKWNRIINNDYARSLAREIDRDSIVLLKNEQAALPIPKGRKVAVIGPMADGFMNYGDYVVYRSQYRGVTPLTGIQSAIGNGSVTYAQGCERWSSDESGFPEAVSAAEAADVAIVVIGTWSRDQQELWPGLNATTGEHVDVDDLSLVGAMRPLIQAVLNTTTPTVIVFQSGKPITEPWISNTTASLVQQFYPSEQGGNALADILFGDVNPSGKLSVSFPHYVGDLPVYYDYLNSGRPVDLGAIGPNGQLYFGHQYVLGTPEPWFPFGYGLSYTTFEYSNVSLSAQNVSASATLAATVSVTNSGTRAGAEVVQMYVKDMLASVDVPNMQLKGFEKVMVDAGETVEVSIPLNVSDCGVWQGRQGSMRYVVEPGEFVVYVGASSADLRGNASFYVS
ncbi:hypothetical protein B0A50_00352 [Salinomyces thailandicus]|uniref:beta-glucosidase n=1 Tax=Salinomyces thailandicus TaxID=706561 RepID=A0A4U0UFM7_9PEZI|nr:hypothetical protein B0A50_00352 [Salinomyces thailandica]